MPQALEVCTFTDGFSEVRALFVRGCVRVSARACEFVYVNEDGLQDQ